MKSRKQILKKEKKTAYEQNEIINKKETIIKNLTNSGPEKYNSELNIYQRG